MDYYDIAVKKYTRDVSVIGGYFDWLPKELLKVIETYIEYNDIYDKLGQIRELNRLAETLYDSMRQYFVRRKIFGKCSLAFDRLDCRGGFQLILNDEDMLHKYYRKYGPLLNSKFEISADPNFSNEFSSQYYECKIDLVEYFFRSGFEFLCHGDRINDVSKYIKVHGFGDFELDVEAILKL